MTRSSLTEETASTPGWVEGRVREVFAPVQDDGVREAYLDCLGRVGGGTDVDLGHDGCRQAALNALAGRAGLEELDRALQALEAEISRDT